MKKFIFPFLVTLFLFSIESARCMITTEISDDKAGEKKYNTITVNFDDQSRATKTQVQRDKLVDAVEDLAAGPENRYGISSIHFYNYKNDDDIVIIDSALNKLLVRKFLSSDISLMYDPHKDAVNKDDLTAAMGKIEKRVQSAVLN